MKQYTGSMSAQRGGTLVGFVVGVLVGLAVALVVAVYVTRLPVPLVDRGVSRKPAQDAEEAERNKGWDPNAGLVGKQPAVPAPPPPPVESSPSAPGVPGSDSKPAPAAEGTPAAAGDPLGDLMKAKAGTGEPGATVSAAPADPFVYFVQAGAFRSGDEAQAQKAKLAMMGMEATVTEREQGGRMVFRVRMGPFEQKATAELTRDQLQNGGVEAALVRVQR